MRIIFVGSPEIALPTLLKLYADPMHEIVAVISKPDSLKGRGRKISVAPIAEFANKNNLLLLQPDSLRDQVFVDKLNALNADICVVVAFGKIIPTSILTIPKYGWINLHFSILPLWRGAAPIPAAILHGDEVTGVSIFAIQPGLDDGPIYSQSTIEILPNDTTTTLKTKLAEIGANLMLNTLTEINLDTIVPIPQNESLVSYAPKVMVSDAQINWNLPAYLIDRKIRAYADSPGAWTFFKNKRIKIYSVNINRASMAATQEYKSLAPGEIIKSDKRILVKTATDCLELIQLQPESKSIQSALAWFNGIKFNLLEKLKFNDR